MIHVEPQPEPDTFDQTVRQPGRTWLAAHPNEADPLEPHWQRCLLDLFEAYDGTCAYLAVRIQRGTGARTTDHFAPKSKQRDRAYEWSNYRLTCQLMNARKNAFEDVLDPFEVRNGWFEVEFSFLQVRPNPELDEQTQGRVQATICRLKLNDPECIAAREQHYDEYLIGGDIGYLDRWCPFLALELRRQGLAPEGNA